jgi:septum formation protein
VSDSSSAPPPRLILASTSQYRRDLLARLGLPFEVEAPGVDETAHSGESPAGRASRLALAKATAVSVRAPGAVVIGSDQVATLGERVLDKPGTVARCRDQLASLSQREARFFTAVAVVGPRKHDVRAHLDTTSVRFRKLNPAEIERYIARERPLDCAGAFKVESLGIALLDRIETQDPTALVGLPLAWLSGALRAAGFAVP